MSEAAMEGSQNAQPERLVVPDRIWEEVVPRLKDAIAREFESLPGKWSEGGDHVDWMRASLQYIGALDRHRVETLPIAREPSWWSKNITGFMAVVALLSIIFAGILVLNKDAQNGLIDITKLLIGALIGSAAGVAGVAASSAGTSTPTRKG